MCSSEKQIRRGFQLSSIFSSHCPVFDSGHAMLHNGFMVPYWLTTRTIFAISTDHNNMIFLIIPVNFFFEFQDAEDEADSDKASGRYKNLGKRVFFTIVKKNNNR
jgi:hypothetical protein